MRAIYYSTTFLIMFLTVLQASAEDEQTIEITFLGKPVIDIAKEDRLLRADLKITNFDPSDGHFYMQITQLSTQKIIYEKEILADHKGNGVYGMPVAYLVDEHSIKKEGEVVGDYEMLVASESGGTITKANFSIINSKIPPNIVISNSGSENQNDGIGLLTSESKQIPEWIRDIFIWYSEDKISEEELLAAIKSLIQMKIIEV
ncbi:MAG: hypothetical protein ACT4OW_02075 [Nitrososphaerota archaeon]